MKILALVGISRSGIDFIQSLFDSHPEVLQFPGKFYYDELIPMSINLHCIGQNLSPRLARR